ncbi:rRNA maturation RNase YbeY [Clostridium cellulovorans]|uniref:Endoribonuclease YbeY n=1 Tax=Clostridium cellulovorans (strain ATCC 35296 / DSM 3052 / OCM 3 / 743B) TaxID=573061 RepID=D9SW56_CLOC7|nr:rRNA maturation RNase YbeY [Clostridium cellulovorans]ADL51200.1 protein of unknown function UPF0054 [Clostridium cellulovorans 743B]
MIYLDNRQSEVEVDDDFNGTIRKVIDYALKEEGVNIPYEISIIYVDNETIRNINSDTRKIDKVTDVLSFPMLDYPKGQVYKNTYEDQSFHVVDLDDGYLVLGDIVLSLEKAKEQSEEYGHSYLRETCYLVIHSVLHLLGYDHMEEEEKGIMRKREETILSEFSIVR